MTLTNLTPHSLSLVTAEGPPIILPPSGAVARLAVTREARPSLTLEGSTLQVVRPTLGAVEGLPSPVAGVIYVVSAIVAETARREDVMSPGELVRDAGGVVIGARGLCAYV